MRRICSSDGDFLKRTAELKKHLTCRGYSPPFIQGQIDRASSIRRADALTPGSREANRRVPLVVTYHPSLPNLPTITRDNIPVLHASQRLKNAIPESPIVAYRRPKNLRDLLVSSHLKPPSFEPALVAADAASPATTCRQGQPSGAQPPGLATTLVPRPPASRAMSSTSSNAGSATNSM